MDRIAITGGAQLKRIIPVSGAKNSAIKLMAASLLTGSAAAPDQHAAPGRHQFLGKLLTRLGTNVDEREGPDGSETIPHAAEITSGFAPYDLSARCAPRSTCWAR